MRNELEELRRHNEEVASYSEGKEKRIVELERQVKEAMVALGSFRLEAV